MRRWFIATLGGLIGAAPMVVFAITRRDAQQISWIDAFSPTVARATAAWFSSPEPWIAFVLLGLAAFGAFTAVRRRPNAAGMLVVTWLIVTPLVATLYSLAVEPVLTPRYLAGIAPAFAITVALGAAALPGRLLQTTGTLVAVLGLLVAAEQTLGGQLQDWRSAVAQVDEEWRQGDAVTTEGYAFRVGVERISP